MWWSPDASKLAWGSFDDTDVDTYFLQKYGSWEHIQPYPELLEVPYPKVGMKNPKNSLFISDVSNGAMKTKQVLPPQSLMEESNGQVHFSDVTWADGGEKFAVTWFNRLQNKSVITLCDVNDLDCSKRENELFVRVNIKNLTLICQFSLASFDKTISRIFLRARFQFFSIWWCCPTFNTEYRHFITKSSQMYKRVSKI